MKNTLLTFIICLLFTASGINAQQTYPIYVTPQLTPPYSLTLSDYSQFGSQRLVVNINVRDVTVTNLPVRLHLKMETITGITIETVPTAPVVPIFLSGGEVATLFGDDMREYFNINNLQFKGYSKEEYRRTGQLPEGMWKFTVEVRHFATGRRISNQGTAVAWMVQGKPPVLKTPADAAELGQIAGMPLTFSWIPPTILSGAMTQYTFELWEMRIPGIHPTVVAASMPVFYSATQMHTSLVVHPAELMLEPGMNYAWRVTASDAMGQVSFAQGGHSEVRSFTYQCRCDSVTGLSVNRQGQDITYRWTPAADHTSFNIEMENRASGWSKKDKAYDAKYEFRSDVDRTYRFRVQAVCKGNEMNPSDFTSWQTVTIPAPKTQEEICPDCECRNAEPEPPITNFEMRKDLRPGDTIQTASGRSRFIIKSVTPQGDGVYKGQLFSWIEIWGVKVLCDYWDLQVNTDNQIVDVDFKSVYDPTFLVDVDATKEYIGQVKDALIDLTTDGLPPNSIKLDFVIPENPEYYYDEESGTIVIIDGKGNPHVVELPKDEDGTVKLPATLVDSSGKVYEVKKQDGQTVIDLADQQQGNTSSGSSGNDDFYLYFIIEKINKDTDITIEKVKEIVQKTDECEYYSSGRDLSITLNEGRYICIPVRKNINYSKEGLEHPIVKKANDFIPYGQISIHEYRLLSWAENPYNRYDISETKNGKTNTLTGVNYIILNLEQGVSDSLYVVKEKDFYNSFPDIHSLGDYNASSEESLPQIVSITDVNFRNFLNNFNRGVNFLPTYAGVLKIQVEKRDSEAVWFDIPNEFLYDGSFGFDRYNDQKLSAFKNKYPVADRFNITKLDGTKIEYITPYVSAWADKGTKVMASIQENASGADIEYFFEASSGLSITCNHPFYNAGTFKAKNGNYKVELTLSGSVSNANSAAKHTLLVKEKDKNGKIVGKLIFYCKEQNKSQKFNYKIVNVTFGTTPENTTPATVNLSDYSMGSALENYFNQNSFNQAFVQFFNSNIELNSLTVTQSEINAKGITPQNINLQLDSLSRNRTKIADLLKSKYAGSSDANERIIFLINNREMVDVVGFGDTPGNRIVLFKSALTNRNAFVHEIGHTFGLKHPFDTTGFIKGNSTNFMDYTSKRNMFWYWQWKIINTTDFK